MPIYEYVCNECGHTLEALQKLSDAALQTCPACAKDTLKKKISAPGFRLSGSGWYETDFKSKNQKNLVKGESSENSSSSNKDKSANTKDKPAGDGTTKASGKDAAA